MATFVREQINLAILLSSYLGIPEDEIEVQGTDMLLEDVRKLLENE